MTPELRAKIRRLFYAEHWTVGTISSELGVHHDVVRAAIETHRMDPSSKPTQEILLS